MRRAGWEVRRADGEGRRGEELGLGIAQALEGPGPGLAGQGGRQGEIGLDDVTQPIFEGVMMGDGNGVTIGEELHTTALKS